MAQAPAEIRRSELHSLAASDPRVAVVQAYDSLMGALLRLAEVAATRDDVQQSLTDTRPMLALARRLVRLGVMPSSGGDALFHLQAIRNLAVHGAHVSRDQAQRVVEMSMVVADLIEPLIQRASQAA